MIREVPTIDMIHLGQRVYVYPPSSTSTPAGWYLVKGILDNIYFGHEDPQKIPMLLLETEDGKPVDGFWILEHIGLNEPEPFVAVYGLNAHEAHPLGFPRIHAARNPSNRMIRRDRTLCGLRSRITNGFVPTNNPVTCKTCIKILEKHKDVSDGGVFRFSEQQDYAI